MSEEEGDGGGGGGGDDFTIVIETWEEGPDPIDVGEIDSVTVTADPDPISIDDSFPQEPLFTSRGATHGGGRQPHRRPPPKRQPATVSKCQPSFDQFIGTDRKSGIANALLKPLGISVSFNSEAGQNEDPWNFTQAEPKQSMGDVEGALGANGWERFRTDPKKEHWGFNDYRKNVDGAWYHFSVKPVIGTRSYTDESGSYTIEYDNVTVPPVAFSLHFEEAKPGGLMHGFNFATAALLNAEYGGSLTAYDIQNLPPCK